jgi:hypothetical protein
MSDLFGQVKLEIAFVCPNAGLIRTGQAKKCKIQSEWSAHSDRTSLKNRNQSEWRSHSDGTSKKKEDPVRIEVSFGQDQLKKGRSSPNAGLIRTGQTEKSKIQSE